MFVIRDVLTEILEDHVRQREAVVPKWCWNWPHCRCGILQARSLQAEDLKVLVYRDDTGGIRRVPVSELLTLAIVEPDIEIQAVSGCARDDELPSAKKK